MLQLERVCVCVRVCAVCSSLDAGTGFSAQACEDSSQDLITDFLNWKNKVKLTREANSVFDTGGIKTTFLPFFVYRMQKLLH